MSTDRRSQLADLPDRIRERTANWPEDFRRWRAEVREDPSLFWRTAAVRITLWIILGVVAIVAARWLTHALTPPAGPGDFEKATSTATIYVGCTNPACQAAYQVKVPMDFDAWPMKCEHCGQESAYRAKLCPKCRQWYATAPGEPAECPHCAARRAANAPPPPKETGPQNPDDEEDPWE
ncbi:MAG: hypothetical protein PVJ57_07715 [Phycisphaerae bacterium]|jgi:hypothetical protein